MLLKLIAYEEKEQCELLPSYWEIEHIFPQKWDTKFYIFDKDVANEKLEHLGNKLPLEKALNIFTTLAARCPQIIQYSENRDMIKHELEHMK